MKKILSIILCLSMLASSAVFAAPVSFAPIDVESAVEIDPIFAGEKNEDEVEVATSDATSLETAQIMGGEIVPGKNVLTGTTGAYTFDDGIGALIKTSNGTIELGDDAGNAVAKVSHTYTDYHDNVGLWSGSIDRPVYVSFKHKSTQSSGMTVALLVPFADAAGTLERFENWGYPQSSDWKTTEYYAQSPSSARPVTKITVHAKHNGSFVDYYDDLVIMPSYKITYYDTDGSVLSTEYVDPRETTYTAKAGQWTTTQGGTEAVTTITLNYTDVDLYSMEPVVTGIAPGKNILTRTTGAYTFDAGLGSVTKADDNLEAASDNGNAVAKVSGAATYYNDNVILWKELNDPIDRPFYFSVKHRSTTGYTTGLLVNFNNGQSLVHRLDNGWTYPQTNDWRETKGYIEVDSVSKITVHAKHASSYVDYYDDLVIMPSYKITYYDTEGSVLSTEYVDPRETTYTVKTNNVISGTNGWTTIEGDATAISTVSLNYRDIELYPAETIVYTEIERVEITGIDAPVVRTAPDTTAEVPEDANYTVSSVVWTPEVSEKFGPETEYTVNVTLAPKRRCLFTEETVATIGGEEAKITVNADKTATVSRKFTATAPLSPVTVSINKSVNKITVDEGKLTLSATVTPDNATDVIDTTDVVWSVDNTDIATIDGNVLCAIANGTVTVTATSVYDPSKTDSFEVTVSNQLPLQMLTFNAGTSANVKVPEPYKGKNTVSLSQFEIPVRAGYLFGGWKLDMKADQTVDSVVLDKNTTVYASWLKGSFYEFNTDGNFEGFQTIYNADNNVVDDGYYSFTSTSGDPNIYGDVSIDASNFKAIEVRFYCDVPGTFQIFFTGTNASLSQTNSKTIEYSACADGEFITLVYDMSDMANWTGTINKLRLDPANKSDATIKIDYIRVAKTVNEFVEITGITAPVAKAVADMDAVSEEPAKYIVKKVEWTPELLYEQYHDANKTYTVNVTVAAATGEFLSEAPVSTINGEEAKVTKVNNDGSVVISYTFPEPTGNIENTDAVQIKLVSRDDNGTYEKTRTIFVNETFNLDAKLVEYIPNGYRWIGWGETEGNPLTVVDSIVTKKDVNKTFYAQYQKITEFDFSNKYHMLGVTGSDISFANGAAIDASNVITDKMNLAAKDYGFVEVVIDATESEGFSDSTEPVIYFSKVASQNFEDKNEVALYGAIQEITDDGRKAYKCIFDMAENDNWNGNIGWLKIASHKDTSKIAIRSIKLIPTTFTSETIAITGVVAPKTWEKPKTLYTASDAYEIKALTWDTTDLNEYGAYKPETQYTLTAVIRPATGKKFDPNNLSPVTINGAIVTNVTFDEQSNTITAVYTFPATDPLKDIIVSVSGPETISRPGRSTDYKGAVVAADGSHIPMTEVIYTITSAVDENGNSIATRNISGYAIIDSLSGVLTPKRNSTVTIKVTSVYNPEEYAQKEVKIINQGEPYEITYNLNSSQAIGAAPAAEYARGTFTPADCSATRPGYFFTGWSTDPDDVNQVSETFDITEDTTLYAIWDKGIVYEFNTNGSFGGFPTMGSSANNVVKDGCYTFTSTTSDPNTGLGVNVDASQYKKIIVRVSSDVAGAFQIFFTGTNASLSESNSKRIEYNACADGEFVTLVYDMSDMENWKGTIERLRFDPTNISGATVKIDYIRVVDSMRTIKLNANGGNFTIDGATQPEFGVTVSTGSYTVPVTPEKAGNKFVGWCKNSNGTGRVYTNGKIGVADDITFYAIWAPTADLTNESTVTIANGSGAVYNNGAALVYEGDGIATDEVEYHVASAATVDAATDTTLLMKLSYSYKSMTDDKIKLSFVDANGQPQEVEIASNLANSMESGYVLIRLTDPAITPAITGAITDVNVVMPVGVAERIAVEEITITDYNSAYSIYYDFMTYEAPRIDVSIGDAVDRANRKTYAPSTQPSVIPGTIGGGTAAGAGVGSNNNSVAGGTGNGTSMIVPTTSAPGSNAGTGTTVTGTQTVANNFKFKNEFNANTFADVKSSDWFYGDIENSYKLGLMNGKGAMEFDPNGSVTIAEAVTVAARIHAICVGKTIPAAKSGEAWYTPNVNYAIDAKIIKNGQFANYNAKATRRQVAEIFANCAPSEWLNVINTFRFIPDVDFSDEAFSAILSLYNAGIITGVDSSYKFNPEAEIKRSEISAIINRIAIPETRIKV